jgi:hypothetical protein
MARSPLTPLAPSRRRHPRIVIPGTFTAQDLSQGHLVLIRDISRGGFRTESPRSVTPGDTHTFRAVLGADSCVLRATAVYCQPAIGPRSVSVAGWRAAPDAVTTDALGRMIDAVTSVDVCDDENRTAVAETATMIADETLSRA